MTTFITAYGKKTRKPYKTSGESMTKQSFKDECDINNILKKYQKTGLLNHVNQHKGDYTDLTQNVDYHTAQNMIIQAQNSFNSLPSSIRLKFNNDPGQFLDFVHNPDNVDEMKSMGLIKSTGTEVIAPPAIPSVPVETPEA